jgi:hypothetical protein
MPNVRFAIEPQPELTPPEANELAELLTAGAGARNVFSVRLALRLREEAASPAPYPIDLSREGLWQIAGLFRHDPELLTVPAFAKLNAAVLAALRVTP